MANNGERSRSQSQRKKTTGKATDDEYTRQKREYFREELARLRTSLKYEKAKIKPPNPQEYTPDTFNCLDPYFNTYTAECIIDAPNEIHHDHSSRPMALGVIDPWDDYRMDQNLLPSIDNGHGEGDGSKLIRKAQKSTGVKEGSTHLPKFPAVHIKTSDITTRTLYYSDVPNIREELRKKYSSDAATKVDQDYTRTKQDFHRMDLDKMDEYHPISRPKMRATYFAYLQNNAGSRKAIYECIRQVGQKDAEQSKKSSQRTPRTNKPKETVPPVA